MRVTRPVTWAVIVLAGVLLLAAGCRAGPAPPAVDPTPTPVTPLSYDAFSDALGRLDRQLRAEEAATYAGYCVPQPGRREATIAFTAGAEATARAYLDGQPLAAHVAGRTAEYPLALLDAEVRPLLGRVLDLGFEGRGHVDACRNRVVITVVAPTEVAAALAAAGTPLPPYAELVAGEMVTPEA